MHKAMDANVGLLDNSFLFFSCDVTFKVSRRIQEVLKQQMMMATIMMPVKKPSSKIPPLVMYDCLLTVYIYSVKR